MLEKFKYFTLLFLVIFFNCQANGVNRDILWNKLDQQCVPNYIANATYRPCALVDQADKYVLYKVDFDKYQYLLLPTEKISGIEDKRLLKDDTPNYFYLAWQSRSLLTEKLNKNLKENDISLTLNASNARSQDQLHIHISCLSPAARETLNKLNVKNLGDGWYPLPEKIKHDTYYAKKIDISDLKKSNIFKIIYDQVYWGGGKMSHTGAALVNVDKNTFLILVSSGNAERGVAAEEIQDHQCSIAD